MLAFIIAKKIGQQRSMKVDLKQARAYFLSNTAVSRFHLICNMPIFLVIVMPTIIEVWSSINVIKDHFRFMGGHIIPNSKHFVNMIS